MVKKVNFFSCAALVACLGLFSQDADAGEKRVKYLEPAQSNGQGYLNLGKNFLDAYEALLAPGARAATGKTAFRATVSPAGEKRRPESRSRIGASDEQQYHY